jgi:hypothetical protein
LQPELNHAAIFPAIGSMLHTQSIVSLFIVPRNPCERDQSDNLALLGVFRCGYENTPGHLITSAIEHPAILETCSFLEQNAFKSPTSASMNTAWWIPMIWLTLRSDPHWGMALTGYVAAAVVRP